MDQIFCKYNYCRSNFQVCSQRETNFKLRTFFKRLISQLNVYFNKKCTILFSRSCYSKDNHYCIEFL